MLLSCIKILTGSPLPFACYLKNLACIQNYFQILPWPVFPSPFPTILFSSQILSSPTTQPLSIALPLSSMAAPCLWAFIHLTSLPRIFLIYFFKLTGISSFQAQHQHLSADFPASLLGSLLLCTCCTLSAPPWQGSHSFWPLPGRLEFCLIWIYQP